MVQIETTVRRTYYFKLRAGVDMTDFLTVFSRIDDDAAIDTS
jgi:hypothetical protein